MKRILVISLFLLSFLFVYGQFEDTIITVSEAMVEEGDTFQIEVSTTEVLDEWDVIAFQFDLGFDNTLLQYEGISLGTMPGPANLIANEFEPGTLRVAYANYLNISGEGSLVMIEFQAIGAGTTDLDIFDFKYNSTFLLDGNLIDGNVVVIAPNLFSDVVITVDSPVAGIADPFNLDILTTEITTVMGAISFQFELVYDTQMMTYTGNFGLGDVPNAGNFIANETESGVIAVAYANVMPISGAGSLCYLEFQPAGLEGETIVSLNEFKYNSTYLLNLEPGVITFSGGPQEIEVTKNLVPGWNWFSLNVIGESMSTASVLNSVGGSASYIKSQTQYATYYAGMGWFGTLNTINNTSFYKLDVNENSELVYTGIPVDVGTTLYNLAAGWNWISYAPQAAQSPTAALVNLGGNGTYIKSQTSYATYYAGMGWFGTLNNMQPLAGYQLDMSAGMTGFTYTEPALMASTRENDIELTTINQMNTNRVIPDWTVNPPDFEYNGSIWSKIQIDGVDCDDVNDILGAFVGTECRGVASLANGSVVDYTMIPQFNHIAFMPMTYSNVTGGETLTFQFYDSSADMVYDVTETIPFVADMAIGNGMDPFVFHVETVGPPEPHFEPVWTGAPLLAHTITVFGATINDIPVENGDELAVFDVETGGNEVCVGVTIVEGAAPYTIIASMDTDFNATVLNGFYPGHTIIYRIWDAGSGTELTDISTIPGPGVYAFNGASSVILQATASTNIPPVADAGEDQAVIEGDLVQLDGTASYDPDGERVREVPTWSVNPPDFEYNGSIWSKIQIDGVDCDDVSDILGAFVGEECRGVASFANGSVVDYTYIPQFNHIAFMPMTYSNVTGGETLTFKFYDASADMVYNVNETIPFVADMTIGDGMNPFVFTVTTVVIPDLEFLWSAPAGITLSDPTSALPTFTAPDVTMLTEYVITLIVSDGVDWSAPDEVIITVENGNIAPVADAGEDQTVIEGDLVQLDGTASYDPDGERVREVPTWSVNPPDFEYNGSIWSKIQIDGVDCDDVNDILGAFVEEECRGVASFADGSVVDYTYIPQFNHIAFMPMTYSNVTGGETLTFKYYDASADMIYNVNETIPFVADMTIGDGMNPFVFTVTTVVIPDLDFVWTAPEGIELSDPTYALPTFVAPEVDEATQYVFSLVVSDGEAWSEPDEVIITVESGNTAPVIELPEFFSFDEDLMLAVDFALEGYISDPELDPLTLSVTGNVVIEVIIAGSTAIFSAPANWNGSEVMTFTVNDNQDRLIASDDVLVIVNPINDPPEFTYTNTEIMFNEDESIEVDFEEYVSDVDGDELVMYLDGVDYIISAIENFSITFSAGENWNGTDAIIIGVSDNQGRAVAEVNVDIVVIPVNDAPVIDLPEMVEIDEDTMLEFDVSPYVSDIDLDVLSVSDVSIYDAGEWEISFEGLMVYITPGADYYTTCEVGITITDNVSRETASDLMLLVVNPVNDAPYLIMEMPDLELYEDFEMVSDDLGNYFGDVDEDVLTYNADYNAEEITVFIEGGIMYLESVENWLGTTSVTISASDAQDREIVSDTFSVLVIGVNDAPYVYNEIADMELDEDFEPVMLTLSDYFTDPDGDLYNYWAVYDEEAVTIDISTGVLTLSSIENWNGELDITVFVDDNMRVEASDTFHLTVNPVNDDPTIMLPDMFSFDEDGMLEENFGEYIDDIDGDMLYLAAAGNIYINVDITDWIVMFTAAENWYGSEEITFTVSDESGRSIAEDMVLVEVLSVNDAPTIELPDSFTFAEDGLLTEDFMAYIGDVDEDMLTLAVEGGTEVMAAIEGYMVTFTASENWFGEEVLTFTVDDGMGRLTASDDITIFVESVNDAPTIDLPEMFSFAEDGILPEDFSGYIGDVDEDMLTLTVDGGTEIMAAIEGYMVTFTASENWFGEEVLTFTVDDGMGRVTASDEVLIVVESVNDDPVAMPGGPYAAQANTEGFAEIELDGSGSYDIDGDIVSWDWSWEGGSGTGEMLLAIFPIGETVVELAVTDDEGGIGMETTSVNVSEHGNIAPVAEPDMYAGDEDTEILGNVLDNDVDPDEYPEALTAQLITDVTNGLLELMADGSFNYIPAENWNGEDMFIYRAYDGMAFSPETEVILTVMPVNDAPELLMEPEDIYLLEDFEPYMLNLEGYFGDVDEDVLTFSLEYNAEEIGILEQRNGMFEIVSVPDWYGDSYVGISVTDGEYYVMSDLTVYVEPVNDAPTIELPDSFSFAEDGMLVEDLSGNIGDVDEDMLTLTVEGGMEVTAVIEGYMVTFTASENWFGEEVLTFTVDDGMGRLTASDEVMIIVESVNDAPTIELPDAFTFAEDGMLVEDFIAYIGDVDEDMLTLTVEGGMEVMAVVDGYLVTFTGSENWFGEEVLTFTVDDGMGRLTASDEVLIIVESVNDAPTIELPEMFSFDEDGMLEENFADYVEDIDGDMLYLTATGNMYINVDITDLMVIFTAAENWNGMEEITFTVSDEMGRAIAEDMVMVEVMPVNDVPTIELPEIFSFDEDGMLEENFVNYVEDLDEDMLYLTAAGNMYINVDITDLMVIFTAAENWNGMEEITFTVNDYMGRAIAEDMVMVEVMPVNDAPTIDLPDTFGFAEDGMLIEDFMAYIGDVDEDMLTLTVEGGMEVMAAVDGYLVTFTASENWFGEEVLTFMVDDGMGRLTASDEVMIIVESVNDAPTIELPDSFSFAEDGILVEDLSGNIGDVDEDMLTLTVEGGMEVTAVIEGYMVTFTASENWFGEEVLTFTVDDGMGRITASDDIMIIVESVNDDPVADAAGPYYGQADEEGNAEIILNGSGSYDIDGEIVAFDWTWEGGSGSGETLNAIFPSGVFEVMLTVTDNEGGTGYDTANVTVSGYENIPPVAVEDYFDGYEDTEIYGNVLYNDTDPDEYPEVMTADLIDTALNGVLSLAPDGEFVYTPAENWFGDDSFTYRAYDGLAYSEPVMVALVVMPVNDAPEQLAALEDIYLLEDFEPYGVDITGNFTDVDEDELTYEVTYNSEEIMLVFDRSGIFEIQSVENWNGASWIGVTVSDGEYAIETGFTVYVEPENDAPAIDLPDSITMDEGVVFEIDFAEYISDIDADELELTVSGNENIMVMIEGTFVTFESASWYGEELLTFTVNDNMGRAVASDDILVIVRPAIFEAEITIGSAVALEEQTFEISVSTSEIYDFWNIISVEFDLHFNNESFEYVGFSGGEILNENAMLLVNNSAPGVLAVAYADFAAIIGEGNLVTFEFLALNADISEVNAVDFRYNAVLIENIIPGMVEVIDVNHAPVADAGEDQSINELEDVMLDGTGSYDVDGQDLYYEWTVPAGIELDDPLSATPSFTAPEVLADTEFMFTLTVSDGELTDNDEVIITVMNINHAPVADAGEDQTVTEGDLVMLDGSASYDPDAETILTYLWEAPSGVIIEGADTPYPTFTAPSINDDVELVFSLTVSDGELSGTDEVVVTVLNGIIPEITADITVTSGQGQPGQHVYIDVLTTYLDPALNIFQYEFDLEYDENHLNFAGASLDNTIVIPDGILEITYGRGIINFKFISQQSSGGRELIPIEGEGSLLNLDFIAQTGGQSQLNVGNFFYNGENMGNIQQGVINNNAPFVAVPIPTQTVFEDFETFMIDLNTYFSDPDPGDVLTYEYSSDAGIIVDMNGTHNLTISSVADFNGEAQVTVTAWNEYSDSLMVETDFSVVVTPVNDAPVITLPESFSFNEDGSLGVDFTPYIEDVDGDVLVLTSVTNANIMVNITGYQVTFSAVANYNGSEILEFTVDDGISRATAMDMVEVFVLSVNDGPVAEAGSPMNAVAGANGFAAVTLDGSASYDIDGEIVEHLWTWTGGEVYGEIAVVDFAVGNYTITLHVTDNEGAFDTDTVHLSVAPYGGVDPIAYPDEYSVDEDMILTVSAEEGILANDFDDGYPQALTALIQDYPETGILVANLDGSFVYTPPADWFGVVVFTYVAFDGNMFSALTAVTITVNSVNDLPVAVINGPYYGVAAVSGLAMITLEGNDSYDTDGEIVTYEWTMDEALIGTGAVIDYEFLAGTYDVVLTVTDNEGGTCTAMTEVVVDPYVNIAPVAVDDYYLVDEDMILSVDALAGVLANDYDPDQYPEALISILSDQRIARDSFILNEDGSLEYVPEPDYYGEVSFAYYVTDGESISNVAMIYIEVLPVNDAPMIDLPEEYAFAEDGSLEVDFSEFITDIDSEYFMLTVEGNLMVDVTIDDLMVTFTPEADWFGNEILTFTIDDNEGRATDSDDIVIIVTPVNDAPVILAYQPIETDITIYDDTTIEFMATAEDIDSELEYTWYLNTELMPIIGHIFTPMFTEEGDYEVVINVSDGEYTESLTWNVHYLLAPDWQVVTYDNFTVAHGYVTVDGLSADPGDMIGAFVDGECRGMDTVNGSSRVTVNIYGDIVEIVNFKFWDLETDTIYDLEYFTQTYPGGSIGSIGNPLPLAVNTGTGPGWVPVIYTNSTIVYAVVSIEGEDAVAGDLVAAFVGDECRAVTEVQTTRTAIASMVVQGETIETVYFRIWDSSEDIIYNCPTSIQSNPGGVVGYPPNEIMLDFSNDADLIQTINLNGGWNLISLYVLPADPSVEVVFAPIMGSLQKVKDIYSSYDPNLPSVYNTLSELEESSGYYVRVSSVSVLDVTGSPLDPAQTPLSLNSGWNLVAYVNQVSMDVEEAFAELITSENLRKVKDIFSSYDPNLPSVYNTLVNMDPGSGYYVRVFDAVTFYYPLATRSSSLVADRLEESIWEPIVYTNSMITYTRVELEGSAGMILGAFAGEECRAIARIRNFENMNISSLVINGENQEEISFRIYDPSTGIVIDCNEIIISEPGVDYPGMLTLTVPGEGDVPLVTSLLSVYPNPFNPEASISYQLTVDAEVNISVYNSRGQLVKVLLNQMVIAGVHTTSWNGTDRMGNDCASGLYLIRFSSEGISNTHKAILMK
ncbi:MAG: tandem-95 repeat protein [Candidatus Cloacimonetes bacterium]|nr:tandem-95 repeat protein [Candidatus Cloacimonadota bacterium]